jgi:hypothetical protein
VQFHLKIMVQGTGIFIIQSSLTRLKVTVAQHFSYCGLQTAASPWTHFHCSVKDWKIQVHSLYEPWSMKVM